MKPKRKSKPRKILMVEIMEAKPNKLFSEAERQSVRFLRFNQHMPCAACGKKARTHWTMVCEFKAGDLSRSSFMLQTYPTVFAPLTPVCADHPLVPAWPEEEKGAK